MRGLARLALGSVVTLSLNLAVGVGGREAWAGPECGHDRSRGARDEDGTWRVLGTSGAIPSGRSAPAVAAQGRWIYAFGGSRDDVVTGEVTLHDDFHRFDTARHRWYRVPATGTQPAARAFASMVSDADSELLLMYGGATFGDFFGDFVALPDLWAFDVRSNSWTELVTSGIHPGARSGATIWTNDGKLYLFGGIDSYFQTFNDLWSYDFTVEAWQELIPNGESTSPPARHEALGGAAVHEGKVTLYGGETVTQDFSFITLADTWQYDLAQATWQQVTPAPRHDIDPMRNLGAAALVGDALYVHGGDIPGGELCGAVFAQNPTDEVWRFDLGLQRWERLAPGGAPAARLKRSRGVEVHGAMYILGGYDFTCVQGIGSQQWNESVFRYTPSRRGHRRH